MRSGSTAADVFLFRLPGEEVKGTAETAGNLLQDEVDVDGGDALEAASDNKRVDFEVCVCVCVCVNAGVRVRGSMHIRKWSGSKWRMTFAAVCKRSFVPLLVCAHHRMIGCVWLFNVLHSGP